MNILNKLTIKHLLMNKKRTIVSIIGILLSTALMVGIGLIISSIREQMIDEALKENGSYQAVIQRLNYDQILQLKTYNSIKEVNLERGLGFSKLEESKNDYKPYIYVGAANTNFLNTLKLLKGKLPNNSDEIVISNHIKYNGGVEYNVGDEIELKIGNRYIKNELYDKFNENLSFKVERETNIPLENLDDIVVKKYKIVGIVDRPKYENYSAAGYSVYTLLAEENKSGENYKSYITYTKNKDIRDKTTIIAKSLKIDEQKLELGLLSEVISYNEHLLSLYGESKYDTFNMSMVNVMVITLILISVACTIVIYNSFAISVMERKKQFGLFSSIGATKTQLKKTVFFEALIVGSIGIILGIVGAFIGIGTVIYIVNKLIGTIYDWNFKLIAYPLFIIIPLIFMILVVFISAVIPSKKASKISPIEAIKLNDDIKIKSNKIKSNRLIKKLFGIEGDIAYKSIKRSKKKYRITIISLFISIVLFISFSSYIDYAKRSFDISFGLPNYDMVVHLNDNNIDIISEIENEDLNIVKSRQLVYDLEEINNIRFSKKYLKDISKIYGTNYNEGDILKKYISSVRIVNFDQKSYQGLLKKYNLNDNSSILINQYKLIHRDGTKLTYMTGDYFEYINNLKIKIANNYYDNVDKFSEEEIDNIEVINEVPLGIEEHLLESGIILIVNDNIYDELFAAKTEFYEKYYTEYQDNHSLYLKINDISDEKKTNLSKNISKILDVYSKNRELNYTDVNIKYREQRNTLIIVKILLYGFISLVTLIGVTSVFNTINTSMALRRKEFAILRSVGLTPKGFNRILRFETILFGLKSLFYGILFSLIVVSFLHLSINSYVSHGNVILPIRGILFAIIGVFTIVTITMIYSTRKLKKDNIIDTIREENI